MKKIFIPTETRTGLLVIIGLFIVLLSFMPWIYGAVTPFFALLDQHVVFNAALFFALIGLSIYFTHKAHDLLNIPYAVSSIIFGISGYLIWQQLFSLPVNLFLVLGTFAVAIILFRQGLEIEVNIHKKSFWKDVLIGLMSALFLFFITQFILKLAFPFISEFLRYSLPAVFLMFGASYLKENKSINLIKFTYDLTLVIIIYNFLYFSTRIMPGSFISLSSITSLYGAAFVSSIFGIFVGLLGAFVIHRHHFLWKDKVQNQNQNLYATTIIIGLVALSLLVGANPFIAAAISGMFINIKDGNENPDEKILNKTENLLSIVMYMLIGMSLSFETLTQFGINGIILGVLVSVIAPLVLFIFWVFLAKINVLPEKSSKNIFTNIFRREGVFALMGALCVFSISFGRGEDFVLTALCFVVILFVSYLYPWIIKLLKRDILNK